MDNKYSKSCSATNIWYCKSCSNYAYRPQK